MRKRQKTQIGIVLIMIALAALLVVERQGILDYIHLRGYNPPQTISTLAIDDTMTSKAKHLFYVNHPDITTGSAFTAHCPAGGEKTVVLGCYVGNDGGIYIYKISDSRLNGVEQVTAAHETLHAAYRRLSASQGQNVDAMLTSYYEHGLTDQRIKDTIAAYKQSEPNDVVNEMHSVFGTEVANLPAGLEAYYKQYFTNRSVITNYTAAYQNEFTSRQQQVAAYDSQLKNLKQQIDTNQTQLEQQRSIIDAQNSQLQTERSTGQTALYNSSVPSYNRAVDSYNSLLTTTKNLITQYNNIVDARNAVAFEEQQLVQALSANSLPDTN